MNDYLSSLQSYFYDYNDRAITRDQSRKVCGRKAISTQLRLGDLLIRAKLVTELDVAKALERLSMVGGRLGDNLVAIGAISKEKLESFVHRTPREPETIAATGLDESDLLSLMLKMIYVGRLKT